MKIKVAVVSKETQIILEIKEVDYPYEFIETDVTIEMIANEGDEVGKQFV